MLRVAGFAAVDVKVTVQSGGIQKLPRRDGVAKVVVPLEGIIKGDPSHAVLAKKMGTGLGIAASGLADN